MKISYNWLAKYIDIPYSPEELVERLTMIGIEVEGITHAGKIPKGIIAAEILKRSPHPDADKLSVCEVYTGSETLQIVCGAPNCDAGIKAPLATLGTELTGRDGSAIKIKKAKLRGVESSGMLCSAIELGLGEDHSGIMELSKDIPAGTPLENIIKPDTIYDLEITSNRPDWLSFIGIAREIQAISDRDIKYPSFEVSDPDGLQEDSSLVRVLDFARCPKYSARVIKGVTVGESPQWLKDCLASIGLRPINNIVDISNFVMFELGQPLHIFDLDKLDGQKIIVRTAADNEEMTCLDGKKYRLKNDYLVIADEKKPVALAGIMGGELSGVTGATKNILIESAYFSPSSIRKTSKELGLSSDSSHRFERGVDAGITELASNRAARLVLEIAGGTVSSPLAVESDSKYIPVPKTVHCTFDGIRSLLGISISSGEIITIFSRLGLEINDITEHSCMVKADSFRLDIEREADLAEEVIRIYGLSRVPVVDVICKSAAAFKNDAYNKIEVARNELIGLGLTECVNYTQIDKKMLLGTGLYEAGDLLEVINPVSAETSVLRPTLLPGLVKNLAKNISFFNHNLKLFELGKVYTSDKKYPEERFTCCILMTGLRHPERYSDEKKGEIDFFDLKGLIETWLGIRRIPGYECRNSVYPVFKQTCCAEIGINGTRAAYLGELSDVYTKGLRLRHPVFAAIIEMGAVFAVETETPFYRPLPLYPSISRDVALIADSSLANSVIMECIRSSGCGILESAELFDLYTDKAMGSGKKSMAYTLTYRNQERTMTDEEVNFAHEKIKARLADNLKIEFR